MKHRIKQIFKMLSQHIIFPCVYFLYRIRPVNEKLVVLADAHHETCPPHLLAVREKLIARGIRPEEFYFDMAELGAVGGMREMLRFMKLYATASKVFICDNFLPVASCKKRKETQVIQLWHGPGAFKRFGYDTSDDIPAGYRGNVYKNYDVVTVSGEKCVPHFCSAMGYQTTERVVRPLGCSHTDRLFSESYRRECADKFYYYYPDAKGKKVVLWAPTFRGMAGKPELFGEAYIDELSENAEFFDVCFVKGLHPHMKQGELTTDEMLAVCDVLITDYSSVFYEALLLDKKLVFFAPDYEEYMSKRGLYLSYEELPGIIIKGRETTDHKNGKAGMNQDLNQDLLERLESGIKEALFRADPLQDKRRERFRMDYLEGCDGRATDRILDEIYGA